MAQRKRWRVAVAGLGCENCTFNPVETELAAFSPELDRATLEERYVGGRWVCGCCRHGCHTTIGRRAPRSHCAPASRTACLFFRSSTTPYVCDRADAVPLGCPRRGSTPAGITQLQVLPSARRLIWRERKLSTPTLLISTLYSVATPVQSRAALSPRLPLTRW